MSTYRYFKFDERHRLIRWISVVSSLATRWASPVSQSKPIRSKPGIWVVGLDHEHHAPTSPMTSITASCVTGGNGAGREIPHSCRAWVERSRFSGGRIGHTDDLGSLQREHAADTYPLLGRTRSDASRRHFHAERQSLVRVRCANISTTLTSISALTMAAASIIKPVYQLGIRSRGSGLASGADSVNLHRDGRYSQLQRPDSGSAGHRFDRPDRLYPFRFEPDIESPSDPSLRPGHDSLLQHLFQ